MKGGEHFLKKIKQNKIKHELHSQFLIAFPYSHISPKCDKKHHYSTIPLAPKINKQLFWLSRPPKGHKYKYHKIVYENIINKHTPNNPSPNNQQKKICCTHVLVLGSYENTTTHWPKIDKPYSKLGNVSLLLPSATAKHVSPPELFSLYKCYLQTMFIFHSLFLSLSLLFIALGRPFSRVNPHTRRPHKFRCTDFIVHLFQYGSSLSEFTMQTARLAHNTEKISTADGASIQSVCTVHVVRFKKPDSSPAPTALY